MSSGSNGDYQDHVFEVTNLKPALRLPSSGTLEAEEAILYGTEVSSDNPGFTGTGFADYINMSGDYIEWNVNEQLSGAVMLRFKYANGDTTDRPLKLEVNGVEVASNLSFPATGAWTNWSSVPVTVNLKAGVNTVRLSAIGYSGPNVDHLTYGNDTTVLPAKKLVTEKTTIPKTSGLIKAYVSPNPASGNVKLVLNALSQLPVEMEVIDMLGKTYRKMKFFRGNSNSFDFSVKDLATGIYIIKIKQGNNFGTAKLMIDNKSIK
ncbi:MAG: carbohydrate-binding protein [Segetibacter sp.]